MAFNANLPADNSKLRLSAAYIRNNFQALQAALGDNLSGFAAGTKLWFYQDTAPTGWSTVNAIGDSVIGVKGASGSLFATGGNQYGNWQLPDHTLSEAELPSHTHKVLLANQKLPVQNARYPSYGDSEPLGTFYGEVAAYTETTGGNQAHNHGNTWRPKTCVGIICQKD